MRYNLRGAGEAAPAFRLLNQDGLATDSPTSAAATSSSGGISRPAPSGEPGKARGSVIESRNSPPATRPSPA